MVWDAVRTPFGVATLETNTIANPLRLPGQYADGESGLYQNGYRDYDPELGRYVESDPLGLGGGVNTYGYVYQNPLLYIDPQGQSVAGALAGGAVGSVAEPGLGTLAGVVIGAFAISASGDTPSDSDKADKARERKEYSRVCKTPITPTGDPCTDAKNNLNRLKQCLQLRENFSRKWYNDSEPGHITEIHHTRAAINKLENWIRDNCDEQCK